MRKLTWATLCLVYLFVTSCAATSPLPVNASIAIKQAKAAAYSLDSPPRLLDSGVSPGVFNPNYITQTIWLTHHGDVKLWPDTPTSLLTFFDGTPTQLAYCTNAENKPTSQEVILTTNTAAEQAASSVSVEFTAEWQTTAGTARHRWKFRVMQNLQVVFVGENGSSIITCITQGV